MRLCGWFFGFGKFAFVILHDLLVEILCFFPSLIEWVVFFYLVLFTLFLIQLFSIFAPLHNLIQMLHFYLACFFLFFLILLGFLFAPGDKILLYYFESFLSFLLFPCLFVDEFFLPWLRGQLLLRRSLAYSERDTSYFRSSLSFSWSFSSIQNSFIYVK